MAIGIGIGIPFRRIPGSILIPEEITYIFGNMQINKYGSNYIVKYNMSQFSIGDTYVEKYLDEINGSDSNDGSTSSLAYKTLTKLRTSLVSGTKYKVYFSDGCYAETDVGTIFRNFDVHLVGSDNTTIAKGRLTTSLSWTNEGGGVFSTYLTSTITSITDSSRIDGYGNPYRLTQYSTLEEVQSNVDCFYRDTVNKRYYIRMYDDLTPSRNGVIMVNGQWSITGGYINIFENLIIPEGLTISNTTSTLKYVYLNNVHLYYSYNGNGLSIIGNIKIYSKQTVIADTYLDGFNYHDSVYYSPVAIEESNLAFNCGIENEADINNGSTVHDNVNIIRVGCTYHSCKGRIIHDTGDGYTLNVGILVSQSTATDENIRIGFQVGLDDSVDTRIMYLNYCNASDPLLAFPNKVAGNCNMIITHSYSTTWL